MGNHHGKGYKLFANSKYHISINRTFNLSKIAYVNP